MHDVVLSDSEFQPERGNVLSEFDMYFGDPQFALSVSMVATAFHCHPYGHETIGFREDIEKYTTEMLQTFYETYYEPGNAVLMIIGDIDKKTALNETARLFGPLEAKRVTPSYPHIGEPKQEGLRRVEIVRPAVSNVVAFGVKHAGFPSKAWFEAMLLFSILTEGTNSILHKKLVDTGLASKVEGSLEPTSEQNLGLIFVTLSKKATHEKIERIVFETIEKLSLKELTSHYKKIQQKVLTQELIGRASSLQVAMELTEYVSAGAWEHYFETENMIKSISAKDLMTCKNELFNQNTMTIGRFIGKQ